ncbi:hypothetical protein IWW50_003753 [Coemansia erecta]|nr:hypothetical protein IWW50_003753 [Coemansia erecta]
MPPGFSSGEGRIEIVDDLPLPIEIAQALLESVHDGSVLGILGDGMPWCAAIAGTAIGLRLLFITPLSIYQQRMMVQQQKLHKLVHMWTQTIRATVVTRIKAEKLELDPVDVDRTVKRLVDKKHSQMMMQHGCHPLFSMVLPLCQLPIWLSVSFAVRQLCGKATWPFNEPGVLVVPAQGMSSEGLLWFGDLTAVDPTGALPVLLFAVGIGNAALMLLRMQRQMRDSGTREPMPLATRGILGIMFIHPCLLACVSVSQPTGLVLYWFASTAFALMQNLVFQIKAVRKALGFPERGPTNTEVLDEIFCQKKQNNAIKA